jgi:thiamine-phosphate pyrophosphorylase
MLPRHSWQTGGVSERRERLIGARLYLVCADLPDAFLASALRGGVDMVQLRIKGAQEAEIVGVARRYRRLCDAAGALLILNDRPDLVRVAEADGVHVGQDDVSVAEAAAVVGADRLIGLSTHSQAQIDAAGQAGVDYIGVGPIHATPTKPGRPAVGLELVRYAAANARVPFFAIGGVEPGNVPAMRVAGANRVAVVRAITQADDPEAAARALRQAMTPREAPVGAT